MHNYYKNNCTRLNAMMDFCTTGDLWWFEQNNCIVIIQEVNNPRRDSKTM